MLYGTVPFKANNMNDLHKLIKQGKYNLKEEISDQAKDLIRRLLEVDPKKRLNIGQIMTHPWMQDIDDTLGIFNEEEKQVIFNEYTFNNISRYARNEGAPDPGMPSDAFTELALDSINASMRNASEKSIILAPFNSSMSDNGKAAGKLDGYVHNLLVEKKGILNFAARCRD